MNADTDFFKCENIAINDFAKLLQEEDAKTEILSYFGKMLCDKYNTRDLTEAWNRYKTENNI